MQHPNDLPFLERVANAEAELKTPEAIEHFHPVRVKVGHRGPNELPTQDWNFVTVHLELHSWDVPELCHWDGTFKDTPNREGSQAQPLREAYRKAEAFLWKYKLTPRLGLIEPVNNVEVTGCYFGTCELAEHNSDSESRTCQTATWPTGWD